jgi:hypothetical protein
MPGGGPHGRLPFKGGFWRFRSPRSFETSVAAVVADVLDTGDVDADIALDFDVADDTQPIDAAAAAVTDVLDTDASTDDTPADDAAGEDTQAADAVQAVVADQPDPDAAQDAALVDADTDSAGEALAAEDAIPDTLEAGEDDAALEATLSDALDALADDLSAIDLEYPELELLADPDPDLWFDTALLEDPAPGFTDDQEYQAVTHEEAQADPDADVADLLDIPDDAPVVIPSGVRRGGGGKHHSVAHRRTRIIVQKIIREVVEASPEPVSPATVRKALKKLLHVRTLPDTLAPPVRPAVEVRPLVHLPVDLPAHPLTRSVAEITVEDDEDEIIALLLELMT